MNFKEDTGGGRRCFRRSL